MSVLQLPAVVVTGIYAFVLICGVVALRLISGTIFSLVGAAIVSIALMLPGVLWSREIFIQTLSRLDQWTMRQGFWRVGFAMFACSSIALVVSAAAGTALIQLSHTPDYVVRGLGGAVEFFWFTSGAAYCVSLWVGANVLNRAEDGHVNDNFRTFALLFILPLGIWFLRTRITRLLEYEAPNVPPGTGSARKE